MANSRSSKTWLSIPAESSLAVIRRASPRLFTVAIVTFPTFGFSVAAAIADSYDYCQNAVHHGPSEKARDQVFPIEHLMLRERFGICSAGYHCADFKSTKSGEYF